MTKYVLNKIKDIYLENLYLLLYKNLTYLLRMNNIRISQLVHENTTKGRRNIDRTRPARTELC